MDEQKDIQTAEPLMSIGDVVAALRVDYPAVSASSLRFLERIGLVTPLRTKGGHRLFRRSDLERVRRVKRLQDERFSLEEIAARLRAEDESTPLDHKVLIAHAVAGDAAATAHLVAAALDRGVSPQELFDRLLAPALREIGERWADGELSVAQEHAASEIIRDLVAIIGSPRADAAGDVPVIVAAAVGGERHVIGLQMVTTLLRMAGYRVDFLGADVDADFLADAVRRHDPEIVLLSATLDERLPAVEEAIKAVHSVATRRSPHIIVGGQITRSQAERLTALGATVVTDQSPGASVEQVRRLLDPAPAR